MQKLSVLQIAQSRSALYGKFHEITSGMNWHYINKNELLNLTEFDKCRYSGF